MSTIIATTGDLIMAHEELAYGFILVEFDLATTFCEIAASTTNPQTAGRNIQNAKRAYQSAMKALQKTSFSAEQELVIVAKCKRVQELLARISIN
jgi:hypothetical protein